MDKFLDAWLGLDEKQRNPADADFSDIFDMSCKKGFQAIIDAANSQPHKTQEEIHLFIDDLSALPGQYHKAMVTFLDYPDLWKAATRLYRVDSLSHWRKRKNFAHRPAMVDDASIRQFSRQVADYFHYAEGCGKNCKVDTYNREDRFYLFAYPEGHSQQSLEWINGEFKTRLHNPTFEVVFLYVQKEGSLDINFNGSYKALEPLQNIFATEILKLNYLPPDPKDQRVYDLNPLRSKEFDFVFGVASGIKSVAVKTMRLSSRIQKGMRITLNADCTYDSNAIYKKLEDIGKLIPLHLYFTRSRMRILKTSETWGLKVTLFDL